MSIYDVAIVGAGPAGLFTALKLLQLSSSTDNPLKIVVIEQGKLIQERLCPAIKSHTACKKCSKCSIMTGVAGAGAFSDGKFPITNDFGGELWKKCGKEKALELMRAVDEQNRVLWLKSLPKGVFVQYKWPELHSSVDSIYKKICIQHNLYLLDAEIRHLGTDLSQQIYTELYNILVNNGVEIMTETIVSDIEKKPDLYWVNVNWGGEGHTYYKAKNVVVAAGRSGSSWVNSLCEHLNIPTQSNRVDIGIRFECPNEIWNHITKDLYESKIVYKTKLYEDQVRTFCMNPSGEVVTENTNGIITVNGHAFEDESKKTNNTNFALLVSRTFTKPFKDSSKYGSAIAALSNMLGGGVIVQRYGDLIRGKRSTEERMKNNSVIPTLNAEPGNLGDILPKRTLDDILEMIEKLDHLVPGMTNDDNLLYGVEVKFYNSVVETKDNCEAKDYPGLYFIGDGAGYTHSLSQASANGFYVAEDIMKRFC